MNRPNGYKTKRAAIAAGNVVLIPLTQDRFAFVDREDYEKLSKDSWSYEQRGSYVGGYAMRKKMVNRKRTKYYMHREIMGNPKGFDVDHRNGNGLDNRKVNLRVCTRSENMANRPKPAGRKSSTYKGVWRNPSNDSWHARIMYQKKTIHIGTYESEVDAALAYDKAAREFFGSFAKINFPIS